MSHPKKLVLRKETLSELSTDMLESVVGGTFPTILGPTFECTREVQCINDISAEVCPTLPVEVCIATEAVCH